MEAEERAAQSAKLQELIRRGGPEDLQEANRLMKVMAGYDTRHKTDYRAKAAEEVAKIQQKAKILEEMLQSHQPGDQVADGDVFEVRVPVWLFRSLQLTGVGTCQCLTKRSPEDSKDVRRGVRRL
jgi:N-terminal extension of GAT domain